MNPPGKTHDDGLRGLLRDRFEDFEPESPELFDTMVARTQHTAGKTAQRYLPGILSVMLLMLSFPLNELSLSREKNTGGVPAHTTGQLLLPATAADEPVIATKPVNQPVQENMQRYEAASKNDRQTGHTVIAVADIRDQNLAELTAATQENRLAAPGSALEYQMLQPPAIKFSSGPATRRIAAWKEARPEDVPLKKLKDRVSIHAALGANYTQYLLTVLPQENLSINDLAFPDPGDRLNRRLQGALGIDYRNWQLRLNYQEFTQKLSFRESQGKAEVQYTDTGQYTVIPVTEEVSSTKHFRMAGFYLRRIQPLTSTGLYAGAGAGYLVTLKPGHKGMWGQAFVGQSKRMSPAIDLFYEAQFNYSFRPFSLNDPSLTFRPYQVGLSAGIRWNRNK